MNLSKESKIKADKLSRRKMPSTLLIFTIPTSLNYTCVSLEIFSKWWNHSFYSPIHHHWRLEQPHWTSLRSTISHQGYNNIGNLGCKLMTRANWTQLQSISLSNKLLSKTIMVSKKVEYLIFRKEIGKNLKRLTLVYHY